jgi:glycosyltransferase domain-containing protein
LLNLTVIIPTHNRKQYLERAIKYYQSLNIYIIIVDSSDKKLKIESKNSKYLYYKDMSFSFKIFQALKLVTTSYSIICADDDYISKDFMQKAIEFLENNNEYNIVQGLVLNYRLFDNKFIYARYDGETKDRVLLEDNNLINRLENRAKIEDLALLYSLQRTENMKKTYKFISENNFIDITIQGIITDLFPLIYGKYKFLNIPYAFREWNINSWGFNMVTLEKLIMTKSGKNNLNLLKEIFSNYISSNLQINIKNATECFNNYFKLYLSRNHSIIEKDFQKNEIKIIKNKFKINYINKSFDTKDLNQVIESVINTNGIYSITKQSNIDILLNFIKQSNNLYIYGAGISGIMTSEAIKLKIDFSINGFIDDYKVGVIDNINIYSLSEIDKSSYIIISPTKYKLQIKQQLIDKGYKNYLLLTEDFFNV